MYRICVLNIGGKGVSKGEKITKARITSLLQYFNIKTVKKIMKLIKLLIQYYDQKALF
jgi:hypothetical protein